MSEYTPPMSRLRAEYVQMRRKHYGFTDLYAAEFDRALAAHDAQVRAEERERIAAAIEAEYLVRDAFRHYDGTEDPMQRFADAYDEGLQVAAKIARAGGAS